MWLSKPYFPEEWLKNLVLMSRVRVEAEDLRNSIVKSHGSIEAHATHIRGIHDGK